MFYVLFPTEREAAPFLECVDGARAERLARRRAYTGTVFGLDLAVVICGVGQANAAQAVSSLAETGQSGLIVLGGCAGAYRGSGLDVGDVAVAVTETYADTGIQAPEGFVTLEQAGLPLIETGNGPHYGSFRLRYAETIEPAAFRGLGFRVEFGGFLTVSAASGTGARGDELFGIHGALCENMEGAAAAQTAELYGAPFVELRGISNMVEDRDLSRWDIPRACGNCAETIVRVIRGRKR